DADLGTFEDVAHLHRADEPIEITLGFEAEGEPFTFTSRVHAARQASLARSIGAEIVVGAGRRLALPSAEGDDAAARAEELVSRFARGVIHLGPFRDPLVGDARGEGASEVGSRGERA